MNNDETYTPCTKCGRPLSYCKGQCCGKTKGCQCKEYCGSTCAAIRPGEPKCPPQAVIPSLTVESVSNLKDLADCFVHVSDINTTFYIDDKHRIMTTWAGLVSVEDYDFEANPLNLRGQIAYDSKNNVAAIYDKQGANYIFQISDIDNNYMLLENKPQINGVTLDGNKTSADLGILEVNEVALVFDTVADMKAATNLVDGSYARTLGFHTLNDGGGALYKITNTGTANEMDVIAVGNLFASLINGDNVKQFGAYGDNNHDDTAYIQQAVNTLRDVKIPSGTYLINAEASSLSDATAGIVVPSNTNITLHPDTLLKVIPNAVEWYDVFMLYRVDNITIKGGSILGDRDDHTYSGVTDEWGAGIKCIGATNVVIDNIKITDCTGDGIDIGDFVYQDFNENIIVQNCTIDNVRRNGISVENADGVKVINSRIVNVNGTAPQSGIDLEPNNITYDKVLNIAIDNCFIDNCVGGGVSCWRADNVTLTNSYIKVPDSRIGFCTVASANTQEVNKNITVIGNVFDSYGTGRYLIGSNANTSNNQFNNTNIYLSESLTTSISNSLFGNNTIKQGLIKTALGGGNYTITCKDVKITNNIFSYELSGNNIDPTGSALNGLQFEIGTRDVNSGKKVSGIIVDSNIFEYLNTDIFTAPTNRITNKTSFDLGLINSAFKNNTLRNLPYGVVCSNLQKVDISNNRFENVGFLWAYRAVSISNDTSHLVNFSNNNFHYTSATPPAQCVFVAGLNHICNNTIEASTPTTDVFLKLQDGAYSYVYNNFAVGSNTGGCISCYTNAGSIHSANNEG